MAKAAKPVADVASARVDVGIVPPRLVDLPSAAAYLSLSEWTVRDLAADGELPTIKIPSMRRKGESGRRILFDLRDLDEAIERWRSRG